MTRADYITEMQMGTAGGSLLVIMVNIAGEVGHILLVSSIGATISFLVSFGLRYLFRKMGADEE